VIGWWTHEVEQECGIEGAAKGEALVVCNADSHVIEGFVEQFGAELHNME
jgi:hypothetical protein